MTAFVLGRALRHRSSLIMPRGCLDPFYRRIASGYRCALDDTIHPRKFAARGERAGRKRERGKNGTLARSFSIRPSPSRARERILSPVSQISKFMVRAVARRTARFATFIGDTCLFRKRVPAHMHMHTFTVIYGARRCPICSRGRELRVGPLRVFRRWRWRRVQTRAEFATGPSHHGW